MSRAEHPWSKTSPDQTWDAIVIGSGMGGMTAAAFLAELGKKVLVLEQHYVPGGFTHTFRRKQWRWDVGVHAVGEVSPKSLTGRLLRRLSGGQLEWASLGPVYDEFWYPGGFRIDFPDRPDQFRQNLISAFPEDRRAIDEYLSLVKDVAGAMKSYYLARTLPAGLGSVADLLLARRAQAHLDRKTGEVLEALTPNPKLRAVLASQWGYYGSPPSRSSFAIQALVAKHFMWGGYYPIGGSQRIAETLLGRVAAAGGWTRIHADVAEILVEGDRAVGVRLEGGEILRSARVISAAGVASTVTRLLPESHRRPGSWTEAPAALPPAPAHVCLYLGFRGDIRAAGASAANKWFYDTWDLEAESWEVRPTGEIPRAPCLYSSFPSLKDPTHDPGPEQLHTGEVVTFVPWETFEPWRDARWRKRGADYESLKQRLEERLLGQLLEHMPKLEPLIAYKELSTPVSTDHFVRPMRGSIYGLEPTPQRFRTAALRPRSPIRGLFFAGSEVATVGVIGAMMGGVLAVASAEPRAALSLLRSL
ncbi:MAG: NAD(P)/FAD-dependent oxidoreductase [Myxococcota bacterium]